MSTLGKLFNKSIRLLSSRYSPSSSFLPPYQFSLARNTCISALRGTPVVYPYSKLDPHHYICYFATSGYHFDSAESVLNLFVKTLAKVLRGDKEEAKRRIYYVCTKWWDFSFGAQIDWETSEKLRHLVGVDDVQKDFNFRAKYSSNILQSISEFSPINWNQRLHNMFSYQQSTACKNGENSGHWLFYIREPVGGPDELINYCIELLADFFGSEKKAKERIYIMWFLEPYGFGAEMDVETSKKLREEPNVLEVLPDCAFDVKNKERGVLCIFLSSLDSTICVDYTEIRVDPYHECSEYEETEDEETEDELPSCRGSCKQRDLRATMEARLNKPLLRSSISPNIDNKGHIYASAVRTRSCITTDAFVLDKYKRDRLTTSGYAESSNGDVLCWFISHIYFPVLPHREPIIDTNFSEFRGIIDGMSVALGLDMIRYDLCDNKVVVKNTNYAFCKFIKSRCITSSISKTNFKFHQPIERMLTSYSNTGIFPMIGRIQGGSNRCAEFLSRWVAPYHCRGKVYPLAIFGPPMPPTAYKLLKETPKPWCR